MQLSAWRYLVSLDERPRVLFWIGIALVIGIPLIPRLLLGQDSFVNPHDNLDGDVAQRLVLARTGTLLALNAPVWPIMDGVSSAFLPPGLNVYAWLYVLFEPFTAYVVNELAIRVVAFVGLWLLLGHRAISEQPAPWLRLGVALTFALLPFYAGSGLAVAGQPLLLFAFLNLRSDQWRLRDLVIPFLFPFWSSLPLIGVFLILAAGLLFVWSSIAGRRIVWPLFFGIALLCAGYAITEYKLIWLMFFADHLPSHRMQMERLTDSPWQQGLKLFVFGHYHAATLNTGILAFTVIALLFFRRAFTTAERRLAWRLLVIAAVISAFSALYFAPAFVAVKEAVPFLRTFNMTRFSWLLPLVWFVLFFVVLSAVLRVPRFGRVAVALALALQAWLTLVYVSPPDYARSEISRNFRYLWYKVTGEAPTLPTWRQFWSEGLFAQVAKSIGRPPSDYRVVTPGFHPAIAQFNGFYTLDGYLNNYPLAYKQRFAQVIEPELKKNPELSDYFWKMGNRCYAFVSELGNMGMPYGNRVIEHLDWNIEALQALGGEYILSGYAIGNAAQLGLVHLGTFSHPESPWRVFLYQLPSQGATEPPAHAG